MIDHEYDPLEGVRAVDDVDGAWTFRKIGDLLAVLIVFAGFALAWLVTP